MSLITETIEKRTNLVPRVSVWDDTEFQAEKGKNLAAKFSQSIKLGIQLERAPILPGTRVPLPNPSGSFLATSNIVVPNQNHPFTQAFSYELGVNAVDDLVSLPHGEIDFLYLSGGTISLEQIKSSHDYTEVEMDRQIDGILIPAVRVVFNPQLI